MTKTNPWHRNSVFGDGYRAPMDRERRAQWKARVEIQRRAKQLTGDQSYVALALLRHLGSDGRCDPQIETLAASAGVSEGCVKDALKRLANCGLLTWVRRLIREGRAVRQTSNSYRLMLGEAPAIPAVRCEATTRPAIRTVGLISEQRPVFAVPKAPAGPIGAAAIMARVRERLLGKGAVC